MRKQSVDLAVHPSLVVLLFRLNGLRRGCLLVPQDAQQECRVLVVDRVDDDPVPDLAVGR